MVAGRMLALEARRQGVDADPYAASRLVFLEDKEVIRALYRREVLGQAEISQADLQVADLRSKRQVRLDVIATPDSLHAARYVEALGDTAALWRLDAQDTRDATDWLGFYDVDRVMHEVVFDLAPGEAAGPLVLGLLWAAPAAAQMTDAEVQGLRDPGRSYLDGVAVLVGGTSPRPAAPKCTR